MLLRSQRKVTKASSNSNDDGMASFSHVSVLAASQNPLTFAGRGAGRRRGSPRRGDITLVRGSGSAGWRR
uniref:Uncharacterized protein n=1 Tax=Anopheles atroparvus TaxID=41427 RepID=A0AAG5D228_ANOAO